MTQVSLVCSDATKAIGRAIGRAIVSRKGNSPE
jgi:hypothetical protein